MKTVIERKDKIKILDSVRAGAIIAVFLFHAGYLFSFDQGSLINWYRLINAGGTVGVMVFFTLSGFLLFYQLYKNNEPLDKKILGEYTKKRLLRILPLYYFSIFFITVLLKHDIFFTSEGVRSIIYNFFFIREIKSADGGGTIPINPVYWSLVVEMQFYVLLPIFYYVFYKYKKVLLFLNVILLGILYRVFLVAVIGDPTMQFLRLTPANFDFFAFGMLGAYLYIQRVTVIKFLGRSSIQIACLAACILFVRFYDLTFNPTVAYIFAPTMLGLILMVLMLSFLGNDQTILSRLFTVKPILFIAKISFSIFIWHPVVFEYVESLLISNHLKFVLNVCITLIVSTISYYVIEAPFLRLKSKINR